MAEGPFVHVLVERQDELLECGKALHRSISLESEYCSNSEYCERSYVLYVPCITPSDDATEVVRLPIVFSIHCLGCTWETMKHWIPIAEEYHFVLVLPEGIQRSFYAPHSSCCGYALEKEIDDVGYFRGIIHELTTGGTSSEEERVILTNTTTTIILSKDLVYGMGWSNGGYMVMVSATLFRAIAPISGYQVNTHTEELLSSTTSSSMRKTNQKPIGLFMHHAQDDPMVRITGCCRDETMPKCCCQLSEHTNQTCTSAADHFEGFGRSRNGCSDQDSNDADAIQVTTFSDENEDITVVCTSLKKGCRANTTFCRHTTGGHFNQPSFQTAFTMSNEIAEFFARDACHTNNDSSQWNAETQACSCSSSSTGSYCFSNHSKIMTTTTTKSLSSSSKEIMTMKKSISSSSSNDSFFLLFLGTIITIGTIILGIRYYTRKQKNSSKYIGFQKVSSTENMLSTITELELGTQ